LACSAASAALRQNAPNAILRTFPSARHAGNEIDRKAFGCKLYFEFRRLCLAAVIAYINFIKRDIGAGSMFRSFLSHWPTAI